MENDSNQVEDPKNTAGETADVIETADENPAAEAEVYAPDDAVLERAVKAGMSLADAKALPSKEFAERILGALEQGKPAGTKAETQDGEGIPSIDFSGFSEEDGYDPTLVKAINSMRAVVESQAKIIKALKAGNTPKATKAIEARRNLTLARPGGESGKGKSTPKDAEADVLAALRSKFKLS